MPVHLLIVDDEPDLEALILQLFRRQIRTGEYDFTFAHDGLAALDRLDTDPGIDIVLTDLNMPRMDGLTLLAELESRQRPLKAVVVTAYGDMENIRTAMNRGAFDFLTKPIDFDDLRITIRKAEATVAQQKRAARVRATFGRYLSDEIVAFLVEQPDAARLGGEKRIVTLLMSDLRGFSTITEPLPPEQVVEILNIYLGQMAEVIAAYNGTIDEFIGDAILAVFGAPIARDDDPDRAVVCAVAMQQAMQDVNARLAERGFPPLDMGIGLHTGEVVVGNIGSTRRMKYAVVGSAVNLASRIESYTVGGQILISDACRAALQTEVEISRRMEISTKGFSDTIPIFEVEGVGAPYHLRLDHPPTRFAELDAPLPFRYTVLDGKHLTGPVHGGTIHSLSPVSARVRTEAPLDQLANLKIWLAAEDDDDLGELYAKVVDEHAPDDCVELRFTAVPDDVAAVLHAALPPSGSS